jgi:molybdenum-dependent DNA-binding transcriptional regulator ModE
MYEVLDDTAAQVILAIESGDSIRRVAQHLHTPYETVRQAVNQATSVMMTASPSSTSA